MYTIRRDTERRYLRWRWFAYLLLASMLVACATPHTRVPKVESAAASREAKKQRQLAVEAYVKDAERLTDVAYPLLIHGAPLCKDHTRYRVGLSVWNQGAFQGEWRVAARALYGLSERARISHVTRDSPAARAGLAPGDIVIALDGWQVPSEDKAPTEFREKLTALAKEGHPVNIQVLRDGHPLSARLTPVAACDPEVVLVQKDEKNAFTDGKRILVYRGMMDFLRSDEEVAVVVSHELAHYAMGHVQAKKQNAIVGGVVGFIFDVLAAAGGVNTQGNFSKIGANAGALAYSVDFEQEADYVGLYLMARAGYDIVHAPDLWRRMAVLNPQSIKLRRTHPTTPERFVALEKTVGEIEQKRANGAALLPDMQPASTPGTGADPQPDD